MFLFVTFLWFLHKKCMLKNFLVENKINLWKIQYAELWQTQKSELMCRISKSPTAIWPYEVYWAGCEDYHLPLGGVIVVMGRSETLH